jgi:hypothetical protein
MKAPLRKNILGSNVSKPISVMHLAAKCGPNHSFQQQNAKSQEHATNGHGMIQRTAANPMLLIRMFIPDPDLRIPDPGVKNAPDPGSGSATLEKPSFLSTDGTQ